MGLVGYSDSEGSDDDRSETAKAPTAKTNKEDRPAYQKLVNKEHPHKIKVNLPSLSDQKDAESTNRQPEPPAKRQKLSGSGLSGFNAMLSAPKRTAKESSSIRKGVSFKTGAEPAFSRTTEPTSVSKPVQEEQAATVDDSESAPPPPPEVMPTGNPMRFKPLSVARKPQKKKAAAAGAATPATQAILREPVNPPPKPKVSLFPMEAGNDSEQPHIPVPEPDEANDHQGEYSAVEMPTQQQEHIPTQTNAGPDTLDSIASDLNLSASARRQLLGRSHKDSNIKITNFNVDAEYAANEAARRSGEQQEHRTVRAIAPGKHSLRQLVNAVTGQKEALEEQFASGRRNRKEAGSKYGW